MTYNDIASSELLNRTLYSVEFNKKNQNHRMISAVCLLIWVAIGLICLVACIMIEHGTLAYIITACLGGAFIFVSIIASLIISIIREKKIAKFVKTRYENWKLKYYVICSDNFSNFKMEETEDSNRFLCTYNEIGKDEIHQFSLFYSNDFITLILSENKKIEIDNTKLKLFNHEISLKPVSNFKHVKDYYLEANKYLANELAKYIKEDINYILQVAYGNN